MHRLLILAALSCPPPCPQDEPYPTYRDLERFPPPGCVREARGAVRRHYQRMRDLAPLYLESEQERWWDEWAALERAEQAWALLDAAQDGREAHGDPDQPSASLRALREVIGRRAWWWGIMPPP